MRYALGVTYDGSPFEGWQSQPSGNTIQDRLEAALAAVAARPLRVHAAGRTDTGVHATAQVVHFECPVSREDASWVRGTNSHLPPQIAVQWAVEVDEEFHARFSATARAYRYVLYNHPVRHALLARHVGWYHRPLKAALMHEAACLLVGENDYSAFRSSECQARSPVRTLSQASVRREGDFVFFEFSANAFLHHMVRNIVGCLIHVGKGRRPVAWMRELLVSRDRRLGAPTASAAGLYLSRVEYPARWSLPAFARIMPFR